MGANGKTAEERLIELLSRQGMTFACAESCTGGMIASKTVNVPGASAVFLGGAVAYANSAKTALMGVKEETLLKHGAVSAFTAMEMAKGIRESLGADIAVSATGISGPGGGTQKKPVGTVYIGVSTADFEKAELFRFNDIGRDAIRNATCQKAFEIVLEIIGSSEL